MPLIEPCMFGCRLYLSLLFTRLWYAWVPVCTLLLCMACKRDFSLWDLFHVEVLWLRAGFLPSVFCLSDCHRGNVHASVKEFLTLLYPVTLHHSLPSFRVSVNPVDPKIINVIALLQCNPPEAYIRDRLIVRPLWPLWHHCQLCKTFFLLFLYILLICNDTNAQNRLFFGHVSHPPFPSCTLQHYQH